MSNIKAALYEPLQNLPAVEFAVAYGSGVFQQPGSSILSQNEAPMVDYILGVRLPAEWHSANLEKNLHHYSSCLAYLGGKGVSSIAENVGTGVHFNAFVPWKDKMIKYGVIGMNTLVEDILSWKSLYISGRLQKPVRILVDEWDIAKVNQVNLHAAASVALLLLPVEFSEEEFYKKICSLSYMGDVRMLFAEDKNKVQRIVRGSGEHFHRLYRTPLHHLAAMGVLELPRSSEGAGSVIRRDCSPDAVELLVSSLPTTLLQKMAPHVKSRINSDASQQVQRALRSMGRSSSMRQMFSGLLAAGTVSSARYVWKKVTKAFRSSRP